MTLYKKDYTMIFYTNLNKKSHKFFSYLCSLFSYALLKSKN